MHGHQESMRTLSIIIARLNSGAFVRKSIVNYSYYDLTALIHEVIT